MEFGHSGKKRKHKLLPFDKIPKFALHGSLSDHKLNEEILVQRAGMFSPDPFKPNEKNKKPIKLKPILVKERTFPNYSRQTPGLSIKLPELSKEGSLSYTKHFLPASPDLIMKKLNPENNSLVVYRMPQPDQPSDLALKLIQIKNNVENKFLPCDAVDVSFGK